MSYYWFLGFMTAVALLKGYSFFVWLRELYLLFRSASFKDIVDNADWFSCLREDMSDFFELRTKVYAKIMFNKNIRFSRRCMMMREIYIQTRLFFKEKIKELELTE